MSAGTPFVIFAQAFRVAGKNQADYPGLTALQSRAAAIAPDKAKLSQQLSSVFGATAQDETVAVQKQAEKLYQLDLTDEQRDVIKAECRSLDLAWHETPKSEWSYVKFQAKEKEFGKDRSAFVRFMIDESKRTVSGPLRCGLASCSAPATKRCSRCQKMHYCSPEHQVQDWARHRQECGQTRATESEKSVS